MAMGSPARVLRPLTGGEKAELRDYAQNYFEYKNTYLEEQNAH
jgi:carbonic anhydrase/acetyltransferase-like protein (isoleucine patch superfamily)